MRKRIKIHRKARRRYRKIAAGVLCLLTGGVFLLIATGVLSLHKVKLVSPLPASLRDKKIVLSDTTNLAVDTAKGLLSTYAIPFQSIIRNGDIIRIQLKGDQEVWLSTAKPLDNQIASLQLTINHFTIEGKQFKRLDFRFDKPVVEF